MNVNVDERRHQVLAVEPVDDSAVTRNNITEVFNLERPLEATGEEAAERTDDRTEQWERQRVQNKRINRYGQWDFVLKANTSFIMNDRRCDGLTGSSLLK